jgi:hypothetical protein
MLREYNYREPAAPATRPGNKFKPGRSASRPWKVVEDPSGDFLGNLFRTFDLSYVNAEMHWPTGIVFEHQRTGIKKIWIGNGFTVRQPEEIKEMVAA